MDLPRFVSYAVVTGVLVQRVAQTFAANRDIAAAHAEIRDYRRERQLYYGYGPASSVTPEQRKNRLDMRARQKAREKMKGSVKRSQDVHHVNGNPRDNRRSNLKA
eukprot:5991631-Prymnesium_polylepis.1